NIFEAVITEFSRRCSHPSRYDLPAVVVVSARNAERSLRGDVATEERCNRGNSALQRVATGRTSKMFFVVTKSVKCQMGQRAKKAFTGFYWADCQYSYWDWSEYIWWLCDVGAWVNRLAIIKKYSESPSDLTTNVPTDDVNIAILKNGELKDKRYMLPKVVFYQDAEVSPQENNLYPQQGAFPINVPNEGHLAAQACKVTKRVSLSWKFEEED
ncbi:hypothetical protein ARMGADRAFT_1032176, partial [Armillaria gallica]